MDPLPQAEDYAEYMNAHRDGWVAAAGLRFTRACRDEVRAEWEVGPAQLQAYGIVHGGVYAGVGETLASVGAALDALARGRSVVGLENHSTFLRAVRCGRLRAVARPLLRGRRTQVWEADIRDEEERLVATCRVRLLCLEPEAVPAAAKAEPKADPTGKY